MKYTHLRSAQNPSCLIWISLVKQYQKNSSGFDQVSLYTSDFFVASRPGQVRLQCRQRRQLRREATTAQPSYWHRDLWDLWLDKFSMLNCIHVSVSAQADVFGIWLSPLALPTVCRMFVPALHFLVLDPYFPGFSLVSFCYSNTTFLENESPWVFRERCLSGERGVLLLPQTDSAHMTRGFCGFCYWPQFLRSNGSQGKHWGS